MHRGILLLMISLVSIIGIVSPVEAGTNVAGTLSTTTWTTAIGPYRVVDTLTVPEGVTLNIEYGVDVNPEFVDYANRDLRLRPASPSINTGDPASPLDIDGTRAYIGAFPFNGTDTPSLFFEPAECVPGGILDLALRGRFSAIDSLELTFLLDPEIFTPAQPLVSMTGMSLVFAGFLDDTVMVAIINPDPITLTGDTLVVFSFDVAIDAPEDVDIVVPWIPSITSIDDGIETMLVDGVIHIGAAPVSVVDARPVVYALEQNAPNPFNPSTTIGFVIPESGTVRLDVYNTAGQFVTTLVDRMMTAGRHEIVWNGTDRSGRSVASGVYIIRMTAGEYRAVTKVALSR